MWSGSNYFLVDIFFLIFVHPMNFLEVSFQLLIDDYYRENNSGLFLQNREGIEAMYSRGRGGS